jgi:four helix bundle protein
MDPNMPSSAASGNDGVSGKIWDLHERTKEFALSVIRLYSSLSPRTEAQVIGKQFLRSGTSVGAHYREASRARSTAVFVSKMEVGLQELEETRYWLELLVGAGLAKESQILPVGGEATELTAIFVASIRTAKKSR